MRTDARELCYSTYICLWGSKAIELFIFIYVTIFMLSYLFNFKYSYDCSRCCRCCRSRRRRRLHYITQK